MSFASSVTRFATTAEQQAGSITNAAVAPATQQSHPSAPKAWAIFNGTTGALIASYNVASVTRTAAGTYTVNFTTAFATSNYAAIVTAHSRLAGTAAGYFGQYDTRATTNCVVNTCYTNGSGAQILSDVDTVSCIFMGAQ